MLDSGARGSTTTFAQRAVGDVLVAWENEAFLTLQEFGADKFEIVVPAFSILAEPPVSLVRWSTSAARARWPRSLSRVPLHAGRPEDHCQKLLPAEQTGSADPADLARFPKIRLVTVDQAFGGWAKAQADHFAEAVRSTRFISPAASR